MQATKIISKELKQEIVPACQAITPSDFGVEIGGRSSFEILARRIERGLIVVARERLLDGTERVTYRNVLP